MKMFIERPLNSNAIRNKRGVYGVGVNDATYIVSSKNSDNKVEVCPFYRAWRDMIKRCYSPWHLNTTPTYIDSTVVDEWHKLSNFRLWMEKQNWEGNVLDKDLLMPENKIYGPNTCLFVPPEVNGAVVGLFKQSSNYPVGVSFHKTKGKIRAVCRQNNRGVHIGYFKTSCLASRAYKEFKSNHLRLFAESYKDDKKVFLAIAP